VHAAADGDALIAPSVTTRLLRAFVAAAPSGPRRQPLDPLTDREEQVLAAIARGRTNNEIADELHITLSTVKTHVTSLMLKLGVRNRVESRSGRTRTGAVLKYGLPARPSIDG
jgi:DNA-binding NarL/FixJ family response regulator